MDRPNLETLSHPAVLVDAGLGVHLRNAAAAAWDADNALLSVAGGSLQLGTSEAAWRLREGLAAVLSGGRQALGLALRRAGRQPVTLCMTPVRATGLALVQWRDPHRTRVEAAFLPDLFGLTRAEAEVAAMVCDGLSTSDIAAALDVQANTVNAHVKHALGKCGVSRQPQMVSLLLRSVAAGDAPVEPRGGIHDGPRVAGRLARTGNDSGAGRA